MSVGSAGMTRVFDKSSGSSVEKENMESYGEVVLIGIDTALVPRSRRARLEELKLFARAASPLNFRGDSFRGRVATGVPPLALEELLLVVPPSYARGGASLGEPPLSL